MKTAMQELIELLENFAGELKEKYDSDPLVTRGVLISIAEAKKLLPKERGQIQDAFLDGCIDGNKDEEDEEYITSAEYYNKTYNQ
jgi:hypothetical protein